MEHIYKLKNMLWKELEEYGEKGELTAGSLDVIEKLVGSIYKLCKIIKNEEEGYSSRGSYEGGSYEMGDMSNARGRRGRNQYGSYARGYSRASDIADQLQSISHDAPNEKYRREIEQLAERMRNM